MKKTILLIDDEPDIVSVFKKLLENNAYEVIVAGDGVDGIKKAIEGQPDLILLDIKMPNKDGFVTLRELKHTDSVRNIPVVMLTVSRDLRSMSECLRCGAKDFLFKDCDENVLLRCVGKYIS